jgi:hypothetical protein
MTQALRVVGRERYEPDLRGIGDALSRIGYRIEDALADLVDNSIDADATTVVIAFEIDDTRVLRVHTIDDGSSRYRCCRR